MPNARQRRTWSFAISRIDPAADAGCRQGAWRDRVRRRPVPRLDHAPCRPEFGIFSERRTKHPHCRLHPVPEAPKKARRIARPGQDRPRRGADHLSGCQARPIPLHPDTGRQHTRPAATVAGDKTGKIAPATSRRRAGRPDPQATRPGRQGRRSGSAPGAAACWGAAASRASARRKGTLQSQARRDDAGGNPSGGAKL